MKRQLTEFPEGWALGDPERETFRKYNPTASDNDISLQWEKFECLHQSKGSRFKLWPKAWQTWSINAAIWGQRLIQKPPFECVRTNFGNTGMANLARHLRGSK